MASFRICTGLFLLVPVQSFVNLANNPGFPAATVSTNQDLNSVQIRTVVDNNETTCKQFIGRDKWMKIWLGDNVNVGTLTITSKEAVSWKTAITIKAYNDSRSSVDSIQLNGTLLYPKKNSFLSKSSYLIITVNNTHRGFFMYNQSTNGNLAGLELCEVTILGCYITRYGDCNVRCPSKCQDGHCDAFDGKCIHGCQNDRMIVPDCTECEDGYYGQDCENVCGHCMQGQSCDKTNGGCTTGCGGFWTGAQCKECRPGYYLFNNTCRKCGHCVGNKPCNNRTGECINGCEENWTTTKCDVCVDGKYGQWCHETCGRCRSGTCNKKNGTCEKGCLLQWQAPLCKECQDHYYGERCSVSCGNCFDKKPCDKASGECSKGCAGHWDPPYCTECGRNYFDENCTSTCGHCKSGAACDKTTGTCPDECQYNWSGTRCNVCADGFYGLDCSGECGKCRYRAPCDHRTGNCTAGCEGTQHPPLCKVLPDSNNDRSPSSGLYVVIGVITTLLGVAVSVIVVLVYVNQKQRQRPSQRYISQPEPPVGHSQMMEPQDYDKLGVRQTDEYMEITAGNDKTPRDSGSNYVNETLR